MIEKKDLYILDYLLDKLKKQQTVDKSDFPEDFQKEFLENNSKKELDSKIEYYAYIFAKYGVGVMAIHSAERTPYIVHTNKTKRFKSFAEKYEEEQKPIEKAKLEIENLKSTIETNKKVIEISEESNNIANNANIKSRKANILSSWSIFIAFIVPFLIWILDTTKESKLKDKVSELEEKIISLEIKLNDKTKNIQVELQKDSLKR